MSRPFTQHVGLVAPLDSLNVDTDQMVPKQFCKLLTRKGYGRILFYHWRYLPDGVPNPNFVLNQPMYQGASILLTRANFGCGSSREHAAWAMLDYGFRVILAPGYADIFYSNCFKNGILPVTLPEQTISSLFERTRALQHYRLAVNLAEQTITDEFGLKIEFAIDSFRKEHLLAGLDEIELTLKLNFAITAYEQANAPAPLYSSLNE